jgi:hypothetical protein
MNVIRYEDSVASKWIRKYLTISHGCQEQTESSRIFIYFRRPIDSELHNVLEVGSDSSGIDRSSNNFLLEWRNWNPTSDLRSSTFTVFARGDLNFIVKNAECI